jgi:hypothetical protein
MEHIEKLFQDAELLAARVKEQADILESVPYNFIPKENWKEFDEAREAVYRLQNELAGELATAKDELKGAVLQAGESHEYNGLKAVYVAGRAKWDTSKLNKAIRMHPWLAEFKQDGDPYIQLKGF